MDNQTPEAVADIAVDEVAIAQEITAVVQELQPCTPVIDDAQAASTEPLPLVFPNNAHYNVDLRRTGIYTVTLPAGVYWLGDVAQNSHIEPPSYFGINSTVTETNPFRSLSDGRYALLFPTYHNVPGVFRDSQGRPYTTKTGSLGIAPAIYGQPTPHHCTTHVFFTPFTVTGTPGYLTVDDDITINAGLVGKEIAQACNPRKTGFAVAGKWTTPEMDTYDMDGQGFPYTGIENLVASLEEGEYWMGDLSEEFNHVEWAAIISSLNDAQGGVVHTATETLTLFKMPKNLQQIVFAGRVYPLTSGYFGIMSPRNTPPKGQLHTHYFDTFATLIWDGHAISTQSAC